MSNAEFLEDIFSYLATIDTGHVLVAGDLNREAEDPCIAEKYVGGRWHDVMASLLGCREPTTVDLRSGGGGKTIDPLIAYHSLMRCVRQVSIDEEPVGHHLPISMECHWPGQYRCLTLQDPIKLFRALRAAWEPIDNPETVG